MSAGPQLSSFLRPKSKLPPVGGACQWGYTKTVPVLDVSITERARSAGDGPEKRSSRADRRTVEAGVRIAGSAQTLPKRRARAARVLRWPIRKRGARRHREV